MVSTISPDKFQSENFCGLNLEDRAKSTKTLKFSPLEINLLYSNQDFIVIYYALLIQSYSDMYIIHGIYIF